MEICHETQVCRFARGGVGDAEQRGGMDGGQNGEARWGFEDTAALFGHAEVGAKEGLGGRCPEANDQASTVEGLDFGFQPGLTGIDLAGGGFLVETALATWGKADLSKQPGPLNF